MGVKIGVLGGLGLMAEAALYDLAKCREVSEIVAVDLNIARKEAVLANLDAASRKKIRVVSVNLNDHARAVRALKGCRVLVNAAWYEFNLKAMDIAADVKAHYVDLGGLFHMTLKQLKRSREFEQKGLLAVLGCGSTPGIANMMAARLGEGFETLETVGIYDASYDPSISDSQFIPPFSIRTMLDEYEMLAPVFAKGKLTAVKAHSAPETLEFKAPIGRCTAVTVIHSEVATLPDFFKKKGIKNVAFKIVYPEAVRAQLALLSGMGFSKSEKIRVNGISASPRSFVTALAQQSINQIAPSKPNDFEILRVRCSGSKAGAHTVRELDCEMRPVRHLTAGALGVGFTASIVAGLIWRGQWIRSSGVYAPESCLKGPAFFRELALRGAFKFVERNECAARFN